MSGVTVQTMMQSSSVASIPLCASALAFDSQPSRLLMQTGRLQAQGSLSYDAMLGSVVSESLFEGRTLAFSAELEEKLLTLTPGRVNAAIRKYFDAKKLVIVTVGDFAPKSGGGQK